MIYRKTEHNADRAKEAPRDSLMASQQLPMEKLKPPHKINHSIKEPASQPDPPEKIPPKDNPPVKEGQRWGLTPTPYRKDPPLRI